MTRQPESFRQQVEARPHGSWVVVDGFVETGFGVYAGQVELQDGPLRVLPLSQFLRALSAGTLFS